MMRNVSVFFLSVIVTMSVVLIVFFASGMGGGRMDFDWNWAAEKCGSMNIAENRVLELGKCCERSGIENADIQEMFDFVFNQGRDNFAVSLLLEKMEEGFAKGVPVGLIKQAMNTRQKAIVAAQRIISHSDMDAEKSAALLGPVVYALESGVASLVLTDVFQQGREISSGTVKVCIEASEILRLSGVDEDGIKKILVESLDQNLANAEILDLARSEVKQSEAVKP